MKFLKNKIKYLENTLNIYHFLNLENFLTIKKKDIKKLDKRFEKNFLNDHKRKLLYKIINKNIDNENLIFIFNKIIKKNKIILNEQDKEFKKNLEAKYFTKNRALKTIETPYYGIIKNVKEYIYFSYKNVSLYINDNGILRIIFVGNMYISKQEIVFFNKKDQKNDKHFVIKKDKIKKINLSKFSTEIDLNDEKLFIRYIENEIIYISLIRIFKQ